ncbi:TPA: hypothetical protein ACGAD2_003578 [Salmonella enterica subsp. enterica serovar Newport]
MRLNPGDVIKSVHTGNAFVVEHVSADGHFFILQPEGAEKSRGYNMYDFNRSFVRVSESDTLQAGNSPVIPDGWVIVPKTATPDISLAINKVGQHCTCGNCSQRLWDMLLAAAPKPENAND